MKIVLEEGDSDIIYEVALRFYKEKPCGIKAKLFVETDDGSVFRLEPIEKKLEGE